MVKYKVNLKFKEDGKSLNEIITKGLKIELNKKINEAHNFKKKDLTFRSIHYSQNEGSSN